MLYCRVLTVFWVVSDLSTVECRLDYVFDVNLKLVWSEALPMLMLL